MGPRPIADPGELNTIVTSYNRNFPKRNDGNANTKAFVTSPEMVIAFALAGTLDFDPLTDSITTDAGASVRLDPPVGDDLPPRGFDPGESGFVAPPDDGSGDRRRRVARPPSACSCSTPFPAWDGDDYVDLPVLLKAKGKCTTDHISAAGRVAPLPRPPREHLGQPVPRRDQRLHRRDRRGQGSARRRDPALPRHRQAPGRVRRRRGARSATRTTARARRASTRPWSPATAAGSSILARSFARIHETNLKKQGLLPLTFADPATYDEIGEDDRISVLDLASLAPDTPVRCRVTKPDGDGVEFTCTHTFSAEQIEWFKAGSALNVIRRRGSSEGPPPG